MGVREEKRTYSNQFKAASTTNFFLGNIGDWQKLTLELEYKVRVDFPVSNPLTLNNPNILTLSSGDWGDLGLSVGMDCKLEFKVQDINNGNVSQNTIEFTIGLLSGVDLEANNILSSGVPLNGWPWTYSTTLPFKDADLNVTEVYVFSDAAPQGISLDYSHFTNSNAASGNIISFNDGTKTGFVAEDTDKILAGEKYALTNVNSFDHWLTPFQSGMSIELATVEFLGKTGLNRYHYEINVIYMISAFMDDINNFIANIAPDALKGSESLTDGYLTVGSPVYNNPNVTIKNDPKRTQQDGNVGWFDENFNQLPNLFTHSPVVYTNLAGTVVNQLDYVNPIVMTTTISGVPNLLGGSVCQYGFAWLPIDEDVYKEQLDSQHKLQYVSTGGQAATMSDAFNATLFAVTYSPFPLLRTGYSVANASGMDASDIQFIINGTDIEMSITFRPSTAFATFMDTLNEDERKYCIWVSVGDQAPETNKSDRVSLLLDFNSLVTYVEPIGPWDGMTIDFLDHPQDSIDVPILCGNSIYKQDDLLAKISFAVDTAVDAATIPVPTAITYGILTENTATGQQYVLDSSPVDLSIYPDPTQYNYDVTRNFKLGTGNTKNWFKVEYDAPGVGTLEDVIGWYGFKVRWEDWLKRFPTAPNAFYDNTLGQNGLNEDWFDYFNTAGWDLFFYVNITTQLGVYQNLKRMTVLDYDSNATITTTFNFYRDNAGVKGAALNAGIDPVYGGNLGAIIEDEIIWLDITYTSNIDRADWVNQASVDANVYATQNIGVENGAGQYEFRQLSSVWAHEFDIPMLPLPLPAVQLATVVSVTTLRVIRVETRIEANKLINAPSYVITGREGCK